MANPLCTLQNHALRGITVEEWSQHWNGWVWIFRGTCDRCLVQRTDTMTPRTMKLISRNYFYPDDWESITHEEAKKIVYKPGKRV